MGGIIITDKNKIDFLKKMEENIYGSTEEKSKVKVISTIITPPEKLNLMLDAERKNYQTYKNNFQNLFSYFWFSLKLQKRENNFYPPKTKFSVTFIAKNDEILNIALGSFWALIYLGGVGSKMRRGAGSLKVTKSPSNLPYNFVFEGNTIDAAKVFMENNLKKIFENFVKYYNKFRSNEENLNADFSKYNIKPRYPVLSKQYASISLIDKKGDWMDLLNNINLSYKNFRRSKRIDERALLGLPIKNTKYGNLRQASPLIFGVMDLNDGYTVRIVTFKTSIHKDYLQKQNLLEDTLNEFYQKIQEFFKNKNIREIEIPDVREWIMSSGKIR